MHHHPTLMSAGDTSLLVIDVQEKLVVKFADAVPLARNIGFLIDCARVLGVPVHATEQYPRGLGHTIAELRKRFEGVLEKDTFSCAGAPGLVERLKQSGRPRVLLSGIEAHVCVQHTALDLLAHDFRVYVAADAVASRFASDREAALGRMRQAGCIVTSAESAVFEWMGGSAHPKFKEVSRLVKERALESEKTPS